MTELVRAHPARFTPACFDAMVEMLGASTEDRVMLLDPFAGLGLSLPELTELGWEPVGVELEPEWAEVCALVRQGDATALTFDDDTFDVVFTSPSYGNRLADGFRTDATAGTVRSYAQKLGRELSPGSGAGLQWGPEYRSVHKAALAEMRRVLREGGELILNMSDHIRGERRQLVVDWWVAAAISTGFSLVEAVPVATPRFGFGANGDARVEAEMVVRFVLRSKPAGRLL